MSDDHSVHHPVNYAIIFGVLCFCTLMSVAFDVFEIPSKIVLVLLVMGVAVAKALFVMTYFMHLKFEGNWKFLLLAPTCALAMGIPLALLPDIGVHYYTPDPQTHERVSETRAEIDTIAPETSKHEH